MKMLALAFLILIGVMLVAEAFGQHINKGYIYFAMAFSLLVELLNMRLRQEEHGAGRAAPFLDADRSHEHPELRQPRTSARCRPCSALPSGPIAVCGVAAAWRGRPWGPTLAWSGGAARGAGA